MSSRAGILAAIRARRPQEEISLPSVPLFETAEQTDLTALFVQGLERMGGRLSLPQDGDIFTDLKDAIKKHPGKILSVIPEFQGNIRIADIAESADLSDIEIGIVRAVFGVAETGSVCLTDRSLEVNAVGYLPQHLFVLLDPSKIFFNMHTAYCQPEFRTCNYVVFHTGPSATADIEGVLIRGAQGVRSLNVIFAPESENLR